MFVHSAGVAIPFDLEISADAVESSRRIQDLMDCFDNEVLGGFVQVGVQRQAEDFMCQPFGDGKPSLRYSKE